MSSKSKPATLILPATWKQAGVIGRVVNTFVNCCCVADQSPTMLRRFNSENLHDRLDHSGFKYEFEGGEIQNEPLPTSNTCNEEKPAAEDSVANEKAAECKQASDADTDDNSESIDSLSVSSSRSDSLASQTTAGVVNASSEDACLRNTKLFTNAMVKNIPQNMKRHEVLSMFCLLGIDLNHVDFLYLPFDFQKGKGYGYLFVNFITHALALEAQNKLHGFNCWSLVDPRFKSPKRIEARWGDSSKQGGQKQLIEQFMTNPVLHPEVPEEWKPMILLNGEIVPFPKPRRVPKKPRGL